ncbi:hypothetical protein [Lacticaseibacillus salsurivasis]|uniref:hypothetical protein n=1 Tax=Lacticaseibacillus salsurivasis TaxID=3081441 RepID=UPI0030C6B358
MLEDFMIQFFSDQPRRGPAVYLLLTGKKTLSILFSALQHHQLQWLQLYPTLARTDFQAALNTLIAQKRLVETDAGLVLGADSLDSANKVPLPEAYQPWMGLAEFERRLLLAVQVVSEASFDNRRYRPAVAEWATQQAVRDWLKHVESANFVSELTAAFTTLPTPVADRLAQRLVGHDFVGAAQVGSLTASLEATNDLALLVAAIAQQKWPALWTLWGGPTPLLPPNAKLVCDRFARGESRQQIAQQMRLRPSTVNEHLLEATILGWQPPVGQVYPAAVKAALTAYQGQQLDYQALLDAVPGSEFFQVRLFQILDLQGRWPHD